MSSPQIILGNKTYSSWSLRGWLAIKMTGLIFNETVVPLYRADTKENLAKASDAPPLVPVLKHDGLTVWDSLAIMEYLAELVPDIALWPGDKHDRAMARVVVAEMHSGFAPLRNYIPMNLRRHDKLVDLPDDVQENIDRICIIWRQCRDKYAAKGNFLFGQYSLTDAAYAPVIVRLKSIGYELDDMCQAYVDTMWNHPHFIEWRAEADKETHVIE